MTEPLVVEESPWARWGRRAVTVPTYLCLGVLSLALLPVAKCHGRPRDNLQLARVAAAANRSA